MDSNNQQQAYKQDSLKRGYAFEEMVRTEGWKYVKAYFENKVKVLATSLLVNEDKPITDYQLERGELIGLRKLLGYIESDMKTVEDEKHSQSTADK